MFDSHVEESAELYALGKLDELEQARIERHVRGCDDCARRLGEAEATVLRLIEAGEMPAQSPALVRPIRFVRPQMSAPAWVAAVAAAFVIGLIPWGIMSSRNGTTIEAARQQQAATGAMLAGHFIHAPFTPLVPGAPAAKVIYAREGGWLYVIVAPGSAPLDVAAGANGAPAKVASLSASTEVRSVFVRIPHAEIVELLEKRGAVAVAHLVYVAPKSR
ncbi:MAG TPA: zf-HC2 domain-containing protein [Candidatus Tumulicola sp.]|jgi:hypothetical protein